MQMYQSDFKAINLACGGKLCFQPGWVNADHRPSSSDVLKVNLLETLPFDDNSFDVVYHAQFIEHLSIGDAKSFTEECYRILKPGGVLRIVTPDLENQAREYLKQLDGVVKDPENELLSNRYEWIRMEMIDQLTRNEAGGNMVPFLSGPGKMAKSYIVERLGRSGAELFPEHEKNRGPNVYRTQLRRIKGVLLESLGWLMSGSAKVGKFRTSGEAHLTMFDRFSLGKMLSDCAFDGVEVVSADQSCIVNWQKTLLDSDGSGILDCPTSLFVEATKKVVFSR